jgi:hypothetical protein
MTLAIEIPDAQLEQLRAVAQRLGISAEELVRAIVTDQLGRPSDDFERAVDRVLEETRELYQRLA